MLYSTLEALEKARRFNEEINGVKIECFLRRCSRDFILWVQ